MNIKTNLIDITKKRYKKLWIFTITLFIPIIIIVFWYLNEYSFFK